MRLGRLVLSLGLALIPRASAALALPEPTCTYPEPSFGVQLDEDAIATGELDGIYVDGVLAIPVQLGLGMSGISSPAVLVDKGLVNVDVLDTDGALLAGSLELVLPKVTSSSELGYPAWLVWIGNEPFEPNTRYQFQFSFINDTLSDCPEAISVSGTRVFETGTRQAAQDLLPPQIVNASLLPYVEGSPGCCSVPEHELCLREAKCTACWFTYVRTASGHITVDSPLPLSYFGLELELLAGTLAQPLIEQHPAYTSFNIVDPAPEYCFEASLRPRARDSEAVETVELCLARDSPPRGEPPPETTELPASDCADGPLFERSDEGLITYAAFGADEDAARAALQGPISSDPLMAPKPAARDSGCATAGTTADSRWWLCGVVLAALARRRRVQSVTC